jgi:hypothetical protein
MKLMIFGGGDLSQRVVALLPLASAVREVTIVTRDVARGAPLARLFAGCLPIPVRHVPLDPNDESGVATILRRGRPDIVFHASSLISPWLLPGRDTKVALALRSAGFGLMLPAQLPLIRRVMRAIRELDLRCPVVNASYPDLTHPVLATEGLEPTVGVGNAGMIFNTLVGELRSRRNGAVPQLLAHHAQVTPFARRAAYGPGEEPWLFLDGRPSRLDSFIDGPLPAGRLLNALTAGHAVEIIAALTGDGEPLRTSAPGPLGLPGGWPVLITRDGVRLDLPSEVGIELGLDYQARAARGDGVSRIDPDGTVHYTAGAKARLAQVAPHLAEPLRLDDMTARLDQLNEQIAE